MRLIKIVALAFSLSLITLSTHADTSANAEAKPTAKLGIRTVYNDKNPESPDDATYCQEKIRELDMALMKSNNEQITKKSEIYISNCLLMDKNRPQIILNRLVSISNAFNMLKKYREGGMTADLCISFSDKFPGCYITRAESLFNLKQKESALEDIDSAVTIVSDQLDAYTASRGKFTTEERKKEHALGVKFLNNKLKYIMALKEKYEADIKE